MRGLRQHRSLQTTAAGPGFLQNLRRGHDELGVDERANDGIRIAFTNSPQSCDVEHAC
jgi:transposase, IS6 family